MTGEKCLFIELVFSCVLNVCLYKTHELCMLIYCEFMKNSCKDGSVDDESSNTDSIMYGLILLLLLPEKKHEFILVQNRDYCI